MRNCLHFRALTVSALAMACASLTAGAQTQTSFSEHTIFNGTDQITVMAHGDFNGDGREDVIINQQSTSGTGGATYIVLSNGDGTFDAPRQLTTPAGQQIVVGDFNGDGKMDYAALDAQAQQVNIWIGHGDGTFTNTSALGTPYAPIAIAAADMNHDDVTDVVVAAGVNGSFNLQVWMMNNYGTGQSATSVTSGVIVPTFIASGDFDGDGKPDIAVVDQGSGPTQVQVWFGDGKGNLASPTQLTDSNGGAYDDFGSIESVGDFDNNGTSDIAMQRYFAGTSGTAHGVAGITVFKGNTNRTLSLASVNTAGGCTYGPPVVADFNGDGMNDLFYSEGPCTSNGTVNAVVNPATAKGVFGGTEQVVYTFTNNPNVATIKSTQGTKPDVVFWQNQQTGTPGVPAPMMLGLLENSTSGSSFPACGTTNQAVGINVCAPSGSSANSPVNFSISASGPTPMRTVAVWADGQKVSEQLTHAFSHYSFLDQPVSLSAGTHSITIYGTGWDNSLQRKDFTLTVGGSTSCGAPSSAGVNVCKPVNGSTVGSPVEVQAAATIAGTLARMEVWVDGVKMFTETTSTSFDTTVSLANGYHRFDIYAVNTAGTKYEKTVYATVGTPSSCAAPSTYGVHVCSPVNGSSVNSPVQATATANISGSLARMEVWVNGGKMYTETTSTSLSTSIALSPGTYRFDFYAVNTLGTKWETTVTATVP